MTTIQQLQKAANESSAKILTTAERLQPFCYEPPKKGYYNPREEITTPFSYGKHSYGTDGRIMVRLNRDDTIRDAKAGTPAMRRIGKAAKQYCSFPTKGEHACFEEVEIPVLKRKELNAKQLGNPIKVLDRAIDYKFLDKIRNLPGLKLQWRRGNETEALPFIFKDGRGVVMPMRVEPDRLKGEVKRVGNS
jgi:hypothetical protein